MQICHGSPKGHVYGHKARGNVGACAGPVSSFLVVSDPEAAKHVLRATDNPKRPIYVKGLVAEVRSSTDATAALGSRLLPQNIAWGLAVHYLFMNYLEASKIQ